MNFPHPQLSSNDDPSVLCLSSSWDYRHEALCLANDPVIFFKSSYGLTRTKGRRKISFSEKLKILFSRM
jgi:hypothetical protein